MKKIILIVALLPLNVFASDGANSNSYAINKNCDTITDPAARKDCLLNEKKNEAEEHYKNFQENNHDQYPQNF